MTGSATFRIGLINWRLPAWKNSCAWNRM